MPAPIFQTRSSRNLHHTDDTDDTPLTVPESQTKIARFQSFITDKLKPDLATTLHTRDTLYTTITHYLQLRTNLTHLLTSPTRHLTSRINIGCDFYCQAVVPSIELVTVDVGLGFHVDLTLAEAVAVCDEREKWLTARADVLTERASVISAHIKLVYEGIAELMKVQESAAGKRQRGAQTFYG